MQPNQSGSISTWLLFALLFISLVANGFLAAHLVTSSSLKPISPIANTQPTPKPLLELTFAKLASRIPKPSQINLVGIIDTNSNFTSHLFNYTTDNKKVTGQINLPTDYLQKNLPVVVMIRGYVDPAIYRTGLGTSSAAAFFANNDFITVAPDFLGYGDSDNPDPDTFAARLQKPITVIDLIASLKQLHYVNQDQIFLWGHSNGGQIALSVLEITGQPYPTTLWAPVTKPFPYSILYYTDEYDDEGFALRRALANFEELYDPRDYSITNHLNLLKAPIQLHQGGTDDAIPVEWSQDFAAQIQTLSESTQSGDLAIQYHFYPQSDHNLRPDWDTVTQRDLEFFNQHLELEN